MLLAAAGHDVVVVDRATFPSDTLSTHASPAAAWCSCTAGACSTRSSPSGAPPIRRVEFHAATTRLVSATVKDRYGVDFLRRAAPPSCSTPLLQDAAVDAGARLRTGVTVTGVVRDAAGRVIGVRASDGGGRSRFGARLRRRRRRAGLARRPVPSARRCSSAEPRPAPRSTRTSPATGRRSSTTSATTRFAGVFPTHDGEACVWVCAPTTGARASPPGAPTTAEAPSTPHGRGACPALAARLDDGRADLARRAG